MCGAVSELWLLGGRAVILGNKPRNLHFSGRLPLSFTWREPTTEPRAHDVLTVHVSVLVQRGARAWGRARGVAGSRALPSASPCRHAAPLLGADTCCPSGSTCPAWQKAGSGKGWQRSCDAPHTQRHTRTLTTPRQRPVGVAGQHSGTGPPQLRGLKRRRRGAAHEPPAPSPVGRV